MISALQIAFWGQKIGIYEVIAWSSEKGTALIQKGHRIAGMLGYGWSIVLGSKTYYSKTGYLPADTFGIKAPFDVPRENFMACRLSDNAPAIHGTVQYAKEFGIDG